MSEQKSKNIADWLRNQRGITDESDGTPSLQSDLTLIATGLFFIGPISTLAVLAGFKDTIAEFVDEDPDEGEDFKTNMIIKGSRGAVGLSSVFGACASKAKGFDAAIDGLQTAATVAMIPSAVTMGLSVLALVPLTLLLMAKSTVKKYDQIQSKKTGPHTTPSNLTNP